MENLDNIENTNIKNQAKKIIEQLIIIKEDYINKKDTLDISIRKDVVKTELKSILKENVNYEDLKGALETYLEKLI